MATVNWAPVESEMICLQLVRVVAGVGGDVVSSWCHWFLAGRERGDLRRCSWVQIVFRRYLVQNLKKNKYNQLVDKKHEKINIPGSSLKGQNDAVVVWAAPKWLLANQVAGGGAGGGAVQRSV